MSNTNVEASTNLQIPNTQSIERKSFYDRESYWKNRTFVPFLFVAQTFKNDTAVLPKRSSDFIKKKR